MLIGLKKKEIKTTFTDWSNFQGRNGELGIVQFIMD